MAANTKRQHDLQSLEGELKAICKLGRCDRQAQRRLAAIQRDCLEYFLGEPLTIAQAAPQWRRLTEWAAERHPGLITADRSASVVETAEATLATLMSLHLDATDPRLNAAFEAGVQAARNETPAPQRWVKLREFDNSRRDMIRKAGIRKRIKTQAVAGQREKLYLLEDVIRLYGDSFLKARQQRDK
jgi:hypothetical protein